MARVRLQGYVGDKEYDFFQESYTKFMAERKKAVTVGEYLIFAIKALNEKKGLQVELELDEFYDD